ncbi:hypothetical protein G7Z17_g2596 [Cylindrodendrum hubeiense]|uniref:Choline monooxygenase, chloroplastic n=1 Tax=Cylindrodendrum hubeiense TaxID=595255 RepID=A0A9P5LEB3_9HYPO|nr:hypothetical protein G7Z17_g2596 [Cylindrodendrum hubeiense]
MFRLFSQTATEEVPRALPSSWYREPAMYELERRAIFSKRWLLVTHRSRFIKSGDYVRYDEAGFSFFLCLDRQGNLNGFHNICRHRAFPVVTEEKGNVSILACKYHGWSYGLGGKLAKAPRFETMPSFDKEANGLFKVHTHIDARGFVWVNLEAADKPSIPWGADFEGSDTQTRLGDFNMEEFTFDHAWDMKGDYNWKTLVDNYNENYNVEVTGGQIQHFVQDKPGHESGLNAAPTFLFPNASVTMTTKYFYLMRVVPTSPTTTSTQYEVYRHRGATDEEFKEIHDFFTQVETEDKGLCNAAQKNLNAGTYVSGDLHSSNEKGVLHFQKHLKETVMEHRAREQKAGGEIWPTRRIPSNAQGLKEEIAFCEGLCSTEGSKMEW